MEDCLAADAESARSCFSFAFVRDPLDRFVSAWSFLAKGGLNAKDLKFSQKHIRDASIENFAHKLEATTAIRCKVHFRPQFEFVCAASDSTKILVDQIGRFETIDADFAAICEKINISADLPRYNSNPMTGKVGVSDETRAIIRRLYARDYDLFGYDS